MKLVKPSVEIISLCQNPLETIEAAGRTCYKSENRAGPGTAPEFCNRILHDYKHESVIEHSAMTVRFVCDRGVSHELVRHRLAAYSQESTRYCNYTKGKFEGQVSVIEPKELEGNPEARRWWNIGIKAAEEAYQNMIKFGAPPEIARDVLPTVTKTEVVMTANFREWRHVFSMRCHKNAHPRIRSLMLELLKLVKLEVPVIFDDLWEQYGRKNGE